MSMTKELRVCTWNAGGLLHNLNFMDNLLEQADVCVITEHWLYPDSLTLLDTVHPEFDGWGRASSDLHLDSIWRRGCGGVGFLWRKTLNVNFEVLNDKGNDRIIVIKINAERMDTMYLIGVYLPSSGSNIGKFREYLECLEDVVNEFKYSGSVIIAGDLNAHIGNYSGPRCLNPVINERGKDIIKFMERSDLVAVNSLELCTGPIETFYSGGGTIASTVDYILVEKQSLRLVQSCKVSDDHCANLSSHFPLYCSLLFCLPLSPLSNNQKNFIKVSAWKVLETNQAARLSYEDAVTHNLDSVKDTLTGIDCVDELEDAFHSLCLVLKSAEMKSVPKTKFKPYLKPFWKSLKPFHDNSRRCRSIWIRPGRPRDKNNKYFHEYKNAKRLFRREMRRKQQEDESKKFESLEEIFETDRSGFYKALAKLRRTKGKSCSSLKVDGKIVTDDAELLSIWEKHYSELFSPSDNPKFDAKFKEFIDDKVSEYKTLSLDITDNIIDDPFSVEQVANTCIKLPSGKSGGPDSIVYEHVKYAGSAFYEVLCYIFNAVRRLEDVGNSITTGMIRNLYKSGKKDKLNKDNYRGITLLNVFGKVLERIILDSLSPKLEKANIPNMFQFAYQQNKSCVTASFVLQEAISHYIERGSKVYCCFLDASKAFDTVWINGLFYKLFNAGIQGKSWRLLYNWYSKLSSCVMHGDLTSSNFPVFQGVRQGGVLSPWLYLIYNNDIPQALCQSSDGLQVGPSSCDSVLVADDVALLSARVKGLQRMITAMETYSRRWRFVFNVSKTRVVTFGETTRSRNVNKLNRKWILNELEITESEDYTHVGIRISGNFSSTNRTLEMAKKGREVVASLMSTGIRPGGINPIVGVNVWLTIGLPRMLYGCELWSNLTSTETDILKRTNRFAAKRIQGLGVHTKSEAATGSIGLWTIDGHVDKRKLLFLGNLCRAKSTSLHKRIFSYRLFSFIYSSAKTGLGFIPDIYRLLLKYDLLHWINEYVRNQQFPSKFQWKNIVVGKIEEYEVNTWKYGISNKSELTIYGYAHQNLQPLSLWKTAQRNSYAIKPISNLVNLLCGNVPPALMTAVHEDTDNYSCKFCGNIITNIALHFIMHCQVVSTQRDELWDDLHDILHISSCAALWNQDDTDIYTCLISGSIPLRNITEEEQDKFTIATAIGVLKIIKEIGQRPITNS